jgi:raffinose/stachyose/melibiose transport system substrate-binding protein
MGTLVKGGLVENLDPYVATFGWDKEFDPGVIQPNRFSTDGTQFGSGSLYGLSLASEYVAVFYNTDLLAQIGITDPKTLDNHDAFVAALDKAKAAGLQPILLGDATKFPGTHNYSLYQSWYVPPASSDDWVYGKAGTTFDDQAHQQAAADYQSWYEKGYYNQDALALAAADATARFGQGGSVFYIDGDWRTGDIATALGDKAGWMLFPPAASGLHGAVGSVSLPIMISSKTKYPDCAAAYLDFITTSDVAKQAMLDNGRIPATGVPANMQASDPLVQQEISEYNRLIADHGLMAWEDWATPTMLDLMGANTQSLLGGQMTPAQYTKAIQDNWTAFQAAPK